MSTERKITFKIIDDINVFVGTLEDFWVKYPEGRIKKIEYFKKGYSRRRRWRDIPDFVGLYQCSNLREIKSLPRIVKKKGGGYRTISEKILTPNLNLRVTLFNRRKEKKTFSVHDLYARTFR